MTNITALAPRDSGDLLPGPSRLEGMLKLADVLYRSGLLPTHVKSAQAAFAIIQKGLELRVPPMHALSSIIVIQGKPTANAELMLALIYRDHGDDAIRITETSAERCAVQYQRRGWSRPQHFTFSIDEAKRAGLVGGSNPTWTKYPQAMLRARTISAVARMAFPDVIGGMHTPEELGAIVEAGEDGGLEVVSAPSANTKPATFTVEQPGEPAEYVLPEAESAVEAEALFDPDPLPVAEEPEPEDPAVLARQPRAEPPPLTFRVTPPAQPHAGNDYDCDAYSLETGERCEKPFIPTGKVGGVTGVQMLREAHKRGLDPQAQLCNVHLDRWLKASYAF